MSKKRMYFHESPHSIVEFFLISHIVFHELASRGPLTGIDLKAQNLPKTNQTSYAPDSNHTGRTNWLAFAGMVVTPLQNILLNQKVPSFIRDAHSQYNEIHFRFDLLYGVISLHRAL